MKKYEIELIAKAEKAIAQVEGLKQELEETRKSVDKLSKNTDQKLGKIAKATQALKKGFGAAGLAVKGFFLALGAKAFDKFIEVAMQNQVIVDAMAVAFGTVSSVVNQVVDRLSDVVKTVGEANGGFDALGKIVKNSLLIPFNLLATVIYGVEAAIYNAQAAWELSPFGDKDPKTLERLSGKIEEAEGKVKKFGTALGDNFKEIGTNFGEAIGEVADFGTAAVESLSEIDAKTIKNTYNRQKYLQDLRNDAELAIAENEKLQFQFQLQAERQRQERDDVTASIEDRTKANNKLGEILKEQGQLQEANALKLLELRRLELAENPKSIEAKKALIEAEKNLADVRENVAGFESEQRVNREALELEAIELINSRAEAENARAVAKEKFDAQEIEGAVAKLEKLKEIAQQEKELEETRLQEQIDRLGIGTQARQDAEQAFLDFKQQKDFEIAELDKQINDQKKKDSDEEAARDYALQQQKVMLVSDALGAVSQILGENSKAGKAAAIAQATINSLLAFTDVLKTPTTLPEPFGSIQKAVSAAGILASGLATVRKIASTQIPEEAGGGSAPSVSVPPAFNVVGASPENQLAQTLGDQQKQPVKAYVVSDEVTNAQAMDRKIIKGASIG